MRRLALTTALLAATGLAACSSGGSASTAATTAATTAAPVTAAAPTATAAATTTTPPPTTEAPTTTTAPRLQILVTNDDGIGAPGIDALVTALRAIPGADVVVVAPATNQSGTSDRTTPGGTTASSAATASGVPGTAVAGFPADTVATALDALGLRPDVVVSGVNQGQNVGPFVALSGTVGAGRYAARRGIPAIAVSAGIAPSPDYATGARLAAQEVERQRDRLGFGRNSSATVTNINVPSCQTGSVRGIVDVPVATAFPAGSNGLDLRFDCAATAPPPSDDVTALLAGYASRSTVPAG